MKVIICGAGRVGQGIAARLARENNMVTVVDISPQLVRNITTELDVRGIVGHGAYPDILKKAGAEDADMIIAVTYSDEVNMMACQVAHSLFSVPTKVARVRAQSYLASEWNDLYNQENMPIDIIISPEIEIGKTILRRLNMPGAFDVIPFAEGQILLMGVHLEEDCPITDIPIGQLPDLFPNLHASVVGVRRDGEFFAPSKDDPLHVGDNVYFIVRTEQAHRLLEIIALNHEKARHIVIVGAGNIGSYVAQELETVSGVRCRVIEIDEKQAEKAAEKLKKTVILNGDAMNANIQEEAGVATAEMVLCLTNNDKINVLAGVLAKKLGAKLASSLINDRSIQTLQTELNVDMIIDPRATTVSSILRHMRRGRILDVFTLEQGAAEVVEGEVLETSPMVGKSLDDIELGDGIVIGAILHEGEVISPDSRPIIRQGDHIVLLAERAAFEDVERLFRVSTDYF